MLYNKAKFQFDISAIESQIDSFISKLVYYYLNVQYSFFLFAGEKGRRIRELTIILQQRFKFPDMLYESTTEVVCHCSS